MGNRIDFTNANLKNKKKSRGNIKNMVSYDILTDISEHITLVRLMNYLDNLNHAISVVGYWIFGSNYEK